MVQVKLNNISFSYIKFSIARFNLNHTLKFSFSTSQKKIGLIVYSFTVCFEMDD